MTQPQKYFCYIEVNCEADLIVQSILAALSIALLWDATRKYWRILPSHNFTVKKIYILIFLWWFSYMAKDLFSIFMYIYSRVYFDLQSQKLSMLSKIYFCIDWFNVFVIQWILILVPYHWTKRINGLLNNLFDRGSEIKNNHKYQGIQSKIHPVLAKYKIFRMCFLSLPVVFLILKGLDDNKYIYKSMVSSLLVDCLFITCSLALGMYSLKKNVLLKQHLDEDQSKRMFNQYLMIIVANIIRFGTDLILTLQVVISQGLIQSDCVINNQFTILCLFSHYLPIFVILRIYNLQDKPEEMCTSLLVMSNQSE